MKTKLSRIICHCCRRKLVPTVSAVMLVAMVLQTATATPPFPVRVRPIPRPPAPKRIEMAPPQYGFQPTRWKAWPGQAESLQAAADRREQRRRSRYRTLEDVIQRDDEEAGGDLGDSTVETPGVESDAAPREDEYQIPGDAPLPEDPAEPPARNLFDDAEPGLDEHQIPAPSDDFAPSPLGEEEESVAPPTPGEVGYRRGNANPSRTAAVVRGTWRSASRAKPGATYPRGSQHAARWVGNQPSSSAESVAPAGHVRRSEPATSAEPRRLDPAQRAAPIPATPISRAKSARAAQPSNVQQAAAWKAASRR